MSRLGPERTFVVYDSDPDAKVRLPTDLGDFGFAEFSGKEAVAQQAHGDDKYDYSRAMSAVGHACYLISDRIPKLGSLAAIQQVRIAVDQVEKRQIIQEAEIKAIEIAIKGILTKHERGLLEGLRRDRCMIRYEPDLYRYLHRLDALNFIQPKHERGLMKIEDEHRADEQLPVRPDQRPEFDLKEYVYITDEGRTYLANYLTIVEKNQAAASAAAPSASASAP
jgi:hypothetical protein